jgi:hypothetical protein
MSPPKQRAKAKSGWIARLSSRVDQGIALQQCIDEHGSARR